MMYSVCKQHEMEEDTYLSHETREINTTHNERNESYPEVSVPACNKNTLLFKVEQ